MKYTYKVILTALVVFGVAYAGTETKKKTKELQYKNLDLCKFPVFMDVGHYVKLKECHKRKIELKQISCEKIGQDNSKFPCYKGSDVIQIKANFPAMFTASINKKECDENLLKEVNLYWENGVNTIKGCTGQWEELKLCLEVYSANLNKTAPDTVEVGDITIKVRYPYDPEDDTENNTKNKSENKEKSKD
jgi:hypothetical protein